MTSVNWRELDEAYHGQLPRDAQVSDAVMRGHQRLLRRLLISYAATAAVVGPLVVGAIIARSELRASAAAPQEITPTSLPGLSPTPDRTSAAPPGTATVDEALAAPGGLRVSAGDQGVVTVSWTPSTDPRVGGYQVFRNGQLVQETPDSSWLDEPGAGVHSYAVRATDGGSSFSPLTNPVAVEVDLPEEIGLPDLVVELVFNQELGALFLTVSNIGDGPAPASTVQLFSSGDFAGLMDFSPLDAGASETSQVGCTTDATVDPSNTIAEQSESNNSSGSIPPCPPEVSPSPQVSPSAEVPPPPGFAA